MLFIEVVDQYICFVRQIAYGPFLIPLPLGQQHAVSEGWPSECYIFCMTKQWYSCQCSGFFTCTQLLMHAMAHGGCTNTIGKSALKVDSVRKVARCTRGWSRTSISSMWKWTLDQLSYFPCPKALRFSGGFVQSTPTGMLAFHCLLDPW